SIYIFKVRWFVVSQRTFFHASCAYLSPCQICFIPVSVYETHRFNTWNAGFQYMKRTVSSP
ncbi:hypothetical protein, partial [uncultured Prevotella sp.]|uniref:hypothetical protein n=1 Tax=uncultured Prevotella sp. TaxID=159272 RepID=UPI00259BBA23